MKLRAAHGDRLEDLEAVQAELERLEKRGAELQAALEDIEHESRRCNDAQERAGWRSGEAEARGGLLAESRAAIVADREELRNMRQTLIRTRERLQRKGHDD